MVTFSNGSIAHVGVISVGGGNFTNDIAIGLKTTQSYAELLKLKSGCALMDLVLPEETVEVESVGGRPSQTIQRRELCSILEARADETLKIIKAFLEIQGSMKNLGSGVVVTGGASLLDGYLEMCDFTFDVPVRMGMPLYEGNMRDTIQHPQCAGIMGLLKYAHTIKKKTFVVDGKDSIGQAMQGMRKGIKDFFANLL